ncbi:MAG: hypothetical protein ABIP94_18375 [Planctomycetota bacterium]
MQFRPFLTVALLQLAACGSMQDPPPVVESHDSTPRPPPPRFDAAKVAAERVDNEAAYAKHILGNRESLLHRYLGNWVAIAGGRVFPVNEQHTVVRPAATMGEAVAAADLEVPRAQHRFVFRIGEEGEFEEFLGGAELPHVLGNGFFLELQLAGVALDDIGPHGHLFAGRDGGRTEITVAGPDERMFVRPQVGAPGATGRADARYGLSTGFGGTGVLPPETAAELSLYRWEIPGKVTIEAVTQRGGVCHRARARFRFPGTNLDFTLPVAIWAQ